MLREMLLISIAGGRSMLDGIAQKAAKKRSDLEAAFRELFGNDAGTAAELLTAAHHRDFGPPATEAERTRYLVALDRLPRGSTATDRLVIVADRLSNGRVRPSFAMRDVEPYPSAMRFDTEQAANEYGSDFIQKLRGEINHEN